MIETYKIITNKESVNPNKFFQMKRVRTGDRVKTLKVKSFKRYMCRTALRAVLPIDAGVG